MIGIIIQASSHDNIFNHKIFHRFSGKSSLRIVIENALRCEYVHKVIVSMPSSDKSYVNGTSFKEPVISGSISYLNRRPIFHYSDEEFAINRTYMAAMEHGIDDIVLINADSPILPTWLYSNLIIEYLNSDKKKALTTAGVLDDGLEVTIIPYHLLAEQKIYNVNGASTYLKEKNKVNTINSEVEEFKLPHCNKDLRLIRRDQISDFDYMIGEILLGTDISDLIEEMNNEH